MHEFSIAEETVRLIVEDADERGIGMVNRVHVVLGEFAAVMPEAFSTAFACAVKDTLLDGTELVLEMKEAVAECDSCGKMFRPRQRVMLCPCCGKPAARLLAGEELEVVRYDGEKIRGMVTDA